MMSFRSRFCVIFAMLIALVATVTFARSVSNVFNPFYDPSNTSGGLQDGCNYFSVDENDIFKASCNKVGTTAAGVEFVSNHETQVDISSKLSDGCKGQYEDIEPRDDKVELTFKCSLSGDTEYTVDLNDWLEWDSSTGKLTLR